jgi:pimeloyl-ACP methyl ester carboxylesterase
VDPVSFHRIPTRLGAVAVYRMGHGREPAVLWHGMFADHRSWSPVVAELAKHRTLYLVDGPGFGLSDRLRKVATMRECAEAAEDLLEALELRQVDWVGTAWGGHVGLELAIRRSPRVRSLIALSAPTQRSSSLAALRALEASIRALGPLPLLLKSIRQLQFSPAALGDAVLREYVDNPTRSTHRVSLANSIRSFVIDRRDITAELHRIQIPVLLVATDERRDWTPQMAHRAASHIRRSRVISVSGARTQVQLEKPAAVIDIIVSEWGRMTRQWA